MEEYRPGCPATFYRDARVMQHAAEAIDDMLVLSHLRGFVAAVAARPWVD